MNKHLLGVMMTLILITPSLFAQSQTNLSQYENKYANERRTVFLNHIRKMQELKLQRETLTKNTNADPTLDRIDVNYWGDGSWEPGSRVNFTYDAGKITEYNSEYWTGSAWFDSELITYEYLGGVLTTETYSELDDLQENLIPSEKYLYSYVGVAGTVQLTEVLTQVWNAQNSTWENGYKDTYTYDGTVLQGGNYLEWNGTEWVDESYFSTNETETGTEVTYFVYTEGGWVADIKEIYTGRTIMDVIDFFMEINFDSYSFEWALLKFQYPDIHVQYFENDTWIDVEKYETNKYYDVMTGDVVKHEVTGMSHDGTDWVAESRQDIWYNGNTDADSAMIFMIFGETAFMMNREYYLYNEQDQILEAQTQYTDGEQMLNVVQMNFIWSNVTTGSEREETPQFFALNYAYPNPFNPTTTLSYSLDTSGPVTIKVYDVMGRYINTLESGMKNSGNHTLQFDASGLSSGIYLIRLEFNGQTANQRVTLIK